MILAKLIVYKMKLTNFPDNITGSSSTELSINNLVNIAIRQVENAIGLLEGDSLDLDNDDSSNSNSESLKISLHFCIGNLLI